MFRGISKENLEKYILLAQYKINYKENWQIEVLKTILI